MDTRTGEILTKEEAERRNKEFRRLLGSGWDPCQPINIQPTKRQMNRRPPRIGRNDPCPCGSGTKFKKCCMRSLG